MEGPVSIDNVPVADALLEVAVRTRHGRLRGLRAERNWITLVELCFEKKDYEVFYLLILLKKEIYESS